MQAKIPPELMRLTWAVKMLREIEKGGDIMKALKSNRYFEEYVLTIEKESGKAVDDLAAEIRAIDDPGERLIMATRYFVLPILPNELQGMVKERVEKTAQEIRTIKSPKTMAIKIMSALLGIDEDAAEAIVSLVM
ncbi:MAG: hypothetical protein JZD41_07710 [Thermoproteus sp.]|nr:hypothetical protein [Thermoproteus sp.]